MADDNPLFQLRWSNHQSTLISLFDTLLESGALSDCTLAAEGQYLKAHKVVLSACSPYLELLLSQHNEKHPIVILKDVMFQDLKSLMDYMYRGEIKISNNQLSSFMRAAESLQIKGLCVASGNEDSIAPSAPAKAPVATQVRKSIQQSVTRGPSTVAQGLTIERKPESPQIRSFDDGASTTIKRRRKQRRSLTSDDPDSHIYVSNSCDVPLLQAGKSIQQSVTRGPSTVAQGLTIERKPESPQIRSFDDGASYTRGPWRIQRRSLTSDDPDSHIYVSNSCDVPLLQAGKSIQQSVTRGPSTVAQGLTIRRKPESPQIRSCDDRASYTRGPWRIQRRSLTSDDPDSHIDVSKSCDVPLLQARARAVGVPNIPATITKDAPLDDSDHETDNSRINNHNATEGVAGPKIEPTGELI
ncbi:unnamed protein product [Macrosiphum euphorbiae]|uniref:BTB domain-containing protein n=1 Tax=Macrosiphum euphorbiae TaxID=13131 RepID=A0AAV0WHF3_9HEMI|nr:unnamed protein product [Macrosiphum euphorbiae]